MSNLTTNETQRKTGAHPPADGHHDRDASNGYHANGTAPNHKTEVEVRRALQCADLHCECHRANGKVHCPAHDDANPDLSVNTTNGKVLWHCHAGCAQEAVTAAITGNGHTPRGGKLTTKQTREHFSKPTATTKGERTIIDGQVFRAETPKTTKPKAKAAPRVNWKTATIYEYFDEAGVLLFQVGRDGHGAKKEISQRRPDARGGWIYKLENTRRTLYNLPDVLKAKTVLMIEGEKAADRINDELKAAGLYGETVATTNPHGAGKWRAEYSPTLAGKTVCIFADNDKPGRDHAAEIAADLHSVARAVKVIELDGLQEKQGADDWIDAGHSLSELLAIADTAPEAQSTAIPAPDETNERGQVEYSARQIVELLYPGWHHAALETNAAHARRILEEQGDNLKYSAELGFLLWNGRHWERDDKAASATSARAATLSQTVREEAARLYQFAAELTKAARPQDANAMARAAKSHQKHAKKVEQSGFIKDSLHQAAGALKVEPSQFDQKPWLLALQNLTWHNGHLRAHRREDFILNLCPVTIDPHADQSEWLAVLERITGGDAEYSQTLQDAAGYILSGASHLRFIPWLYGPKGTGKSTFAELLQTVLGHLAATIDPKKLQADAARERLGADLWNKRLAVCAEAGSQKLEAELLKTLSGSDTLTVRFLYHESFNALPRHVLMMVANDPPRVDAYDDALKDRVVALPFTHRLDSPEPFALTGGARIEAVRQDPTAPLVTGFAAWALEGLARVYETQSIHRAAVVETATAKFWAETDPISAFWETIEEDELREGIAKSELRRRYEVWGESEGARPYGRVQWARACKAHNLSEARDEEKNRTWKLWNHKNHNKALSEKVHAKEAKLSYTLCGKKQSCGSYGSDGAAASEPYTADDEVTL